VQAQEWAQASADTQALDRLRQLRGHGQHPDDVGGANAVLVKERLEIGAVYTTVLAAQYDFEANGLLVKMMRRF
jgi:hypothetical protein